MRLTHKAEQKAIEDAGYVPGAEVVGLDAYGREVASGFVHNDGSVHLGVTRQGTLHTIIALQPPGEALPINIGYNVVTPGDAVEANNLRPW